ncbi:hypothetical protein BRD14_03290 [Halobacteriales archaeon SW_5_68_122]|nr:MAG: hypothetical protein BRD14_03290 [Halobacteriales archaeon SW_5_68_122]
MDADGDLPGWAAGFLLLSGTIAVAGVGDYLLTNSGYEFLGTFVWAVSYAGALLVVWMVWLRNMELTGPTDG